MSQPGIVKKLQASLVFSIIINLGLILQIIELNQREHHRYIQSTNKVTKIKASEAISTPRMSVADIQFFAKEYIKNFFQIDDESLDFIKQHTQSDLFLNNIEPEILNRRSQKLISNFLISDIFIDDIDDKLSKALIIGIERFENNNLSPRTIHLELIIDIEELKVKEIPVFDVK